MYPRLGQILPASYQGPVPNIAGRVLSYTTVIPGKIERPSNLSITQNGPFFTILNVRWDVPQINGVFTSSNTIQMDALRPAGISGSGTVVIGTTDIRWDNGTVYTLDHIIAAPLAAPTPPPTGSTLPPSGPPGAPQFFWPAATSPTPFLIPALAPRPSPPEDITPAGPAGPNARAVPPLPPIRPEEKKMAIVEAGMIPTTGIGLFWLAVIGGGLAMLFGKKKK